MAPQMPDVWAKVLLAVLSGIAVVIGVLTRGSREDTRREHPAPWVLVALGAAGLIALAYWQPR